MKKLFYLFILSLSLASCVKDTDYDTPQIQGENPSYPANQITTIQNVIEQWKNPLNPTGTTSNVFEFPINLTTPMYLTGYVVSDDRTGNFYKEIFIQDSPTDPQFALKVGIEMTNLYLKYDMGRKIYINLNGLAINKTHGEMVIGEMINGAFDNIRENKAKLCITRDAASVPVTPKNITLNDIVTANLGMFVKLDNLQFDQDLIGKPFVNPLDSYDSYRTMISCASGEVILETSTFAAFKDIILPNGNGSVSGILSRDYNNGFFVLRVNSPEMFSFTGQRCDPLFQDGFSNGLTAKWTTYNVNGAQVWGIDTQYGNPGNCAKMTGYSGSNFANEDWLITKPINLSAVTNAKLNFQTARNYSGNNMVVYVSTNYDGLSNPNSSGTWTVLPATLSTTGFAWTNSGDISLQPYCGNEKVFIGFKYTSTTSAASTYEIDNVKVTEL